MAQRCEKVAVSIREGDKFGGEPVTGRRSKIVGGWVGELFAANETGGDGAHKMPNGAKRTITKEKKKKKVSYPRTENKYERQQPAGQKKETGHIPYETVREETYAHTRHKRRPPKAPPT